MKKIEINEKTLEKLIKEGKTTKEIAEIFNCSTGTVSNRLKETGIKEKNSDNKKSLIKEMYLSEKTVSYHLKKMGVKIRNQKKINQKDFERLWDEGKSDLEIAEYFGVKETTIKSYRTNKKNAGKFTRINYFSESDIKLSDIQEQFILGSLLGDLSIDLTGQMKNAKLCLVHSKKQEELFMKKVELLDNFMGSYKLYNSTPDKRTGKIYETLRGNSKSHKVFTNIYNLLYPNKVKQITQCYLDKIHHPIALAFWFMDDGTERGTIATNCFSSNEVNTLINWMQNKWGIKCTKQKNKDNFVLHISQKDRFKFEQLIFPYMVPSMYHKLQYLNILKAESV